MGILNKIFKSEEDKKKPASKAKPAPAVAKKSDSKPATTKKSVAKKVTAEKEVKKEEKSTEKEPSTKKEIKANVRDDINAYKLIQRPVITEKATDLAMLNKYTFKVPTSTNKQEIKKTIMNVYGVEPIAVHVISVRGKKVRYRRSVGTTKSWKKAIVTLAKGEKIEIYEGV